MGLSTLTVWPPLAACGSRSPVSRSAPSACWLPQDLPWSWAAGSCAEGFLRKPAHSDHRAMVGAVLGAGAVLPRRVWWCRLSRAAENCAGSLDRALGCSCVLESRKLLPVCWHSSAERTNLEEFLILKPHLNVSLLERR